MNSPVEDVKSFYESALDSEFRRLADQGILKEETVLTMKLAAGFGAAGFVLIFIYICCCMVACTCAPEMCSVVYSPLCNCAIRSVCWPFMLCRCVARKLRRVKKE